MYTYKVAGPQVGVEKEILHKICQLLGYASDNDGTFAPGGSMSNYMAMLMARDACNSRIKNDGVQQKMTLYTSKESHYSIPKNAAFMGIGRDQVRYIPADSYGRMIPEKLEEQIKKGKRLDVNTTSKPRQRKEKFIRNERRRTQRSTRNIIRNRWLRT